MLICGRVINIYLNGGNMENTDFLTSRQSHYELTTPAPNEQQINDIIATALRVPDHGKLTPYYFVIVKQDKMDVLYNLFAKALSELDLMPNKLEKAKQICQSSPMIIVLIANLTTGPTVPNWEKLITAGCAGYAIQLAARKIGFDSFWFTGAWTEGLSIKQQLCKQPEDQIIGFIKLGTKVADDVKREYPSPTDFIKYL